MITVSQRIQLFSDLCGQQVQIPNLGAQLEDWPHEISIHQDAIVSVVEEVLGTHALTPAVEAKLKRANLGLLIASWFPFASAQRLKDITYFVCWMYMIDDSIIDKVSWPGRDNESAFDAAHKEITDFVYKSLKLDGKTGGDQPTSSIAAVNSFRTIGTVLCKNYTLTQRRRFYDAYRLTMDGYRTEQQIRVDGRIPQWDEYWTYREGSSCIRMCVALVEFSMELTIPASIMESREMQRLWTETTVMSWLDNDIVSAKKELGEGFIENAIALAAVDSRKAQDGLDRTFGLIGAAKRRFEELNRLLLEKFATLGETSRDLNAGVEENHDVTPKIARQLRDFIRSCQCMVTGSLHWRFVVTAHWLWCTYPITDNQQFGISTLWSDSFTKGLKRQNDVHCGGRSKRTLRQGLR